MDRQFDYREFFECSQKGDRTYRKNPCTNANNIGNARFDQTLYIAK
jgi:hypothetical protein